MRYTSMRDRLISRVAVLGVDECWPFHGERKPAGYGFLRVTVHGTLARIYAHQLMWELLHGPIPDGFEVRHSCDFPTCCNPNHLSVGTHLDNMADAKVRIRMGRRPGMALRLTLPCINSFVEVGVAQRTIAKWFNVSPQAISSSLAEARRMKAEAEARQPGDESNG